MSDMLATILPKSDQLNADELTGGPKTITITSVIINAGHDQPVIIHYDGDGGHPWKPNKGTRRQLVQAWGADANKYVGKSATLYRDAKVKWAGKEEGGVRISHMSHISGDMMVAETVSKGKRNPRLIKPLVMNSAPDDAQDKARAWANEFIASVNKCMSVEELDAMCAKSSRAIDKMQSSFIDIFNDIDRVVSDMRNIFSVDNEENNNAE